VSQSLAGPYNITCEQGATFKRSISWTDSKKVPHDLTGYTARMQVRATVDSSSVILSLTTENGRITVGSGTYNINLLVNATTTAALTPGQYVYDLEVVSGGGEVTRIVQGNFKVSAEVTR
jgi:hypothetical protein